MQLEGKEMIAVLFRGLERGQGAESVQDKASKQAPRRWGGGGPLRNGLTDSLICLILCCCCLEQKLQAYGELDTNPKPCSTHTRAALYTNTLLKGILCKLNRQPGRLTHSSSLSFSSFAGIWGWMQSWSQIETYPNRAWSHLNCVCSL